jgi:hypothetical protein
MCFYISVELAMYTAKNHKYCVWYEISKDDRKCLISFTLLIN